MKAASVLRRTQFFLFCLFLLLTSFSSLWGQDIPETETDSAMSYLEHLADPDLYAGRKGGVATGHKAMSWISGKFAAWGLQPLLLRDMMVPFNMLATEEKKAYMTVTNDYFGKVEFLLGDDFTLLVNSGSGKVEAQVTLVGYGVSSPEKGWDDYAGVDVTGKIVMIMRGNPNGNEDWEEEKKRVTLIQTAKEHGAVAVIFKDYRAFPIGGATIAEEGYSPDFPCAFVGDRIVYHLFRGSGTTFEEYKKGLKEGPNPTELTTVMRFDAGVKRVDNAVGYNVVGFVRGTDVDLQQEAIIIGAHGDHCGLNANGQIYIGADDNASGACVIMELARSFAMNPQKRTLIFVVFDGEEQGLLGSKALAAMMPDNFTYVNMVNLDMVGRGDGTAGMGGGDQIAEVWDPWHDAMPEAERDRIESCRAWGGMCADHAPFRDLGIPAFTGYSRGEHHYYHRFEDVFANIERPAIDGTLKMVASWLVNVGNYPTPLADQNLEARTIWHQGYPLVWKTSVNSVVRDLELVKLSLDKGFVATVLTLPERGGLPGFLAMLDQYRDAIDANPKMEVATKQGDIYSNAYNRKASVFLGYNADGLLPSDTTMIEAYRAMGVGWTILNSYERWIRSGSLASERKRLIELMAQDNGIIQLPLRHMANWAPLLEEAGSSVIFTGNWRDFASIDDGTLTNARDNGAGIMVLVETMNIKDAISAQDRIREYKVHIQPAESSYADALAWIETMKNGNVETDTILHWIAKNQRYW